MPKIPLFTFPNNPRIILRDFYGYQSVSVHFLDGQLLNDTPKI